MSEWARHLVVLAFVVVAVAGCMGEEDDLPRVATATSPMPESTTSTAEAATTTTETQTETVDVRPPPLTHGKFIRQLDRICRRGNRTIDRVNKRIEEAFTRGDEKAAATIWQRAKKRLDPPFYAKLRALNVRPRDRRGLRRYLELSRQLDALEIRYIRALRQSDDEEQSRLNGLMRQVSNRRTLVTSSLGLTECGS